MKEQEFISLLQSHPECLFDEKKFRAKQIYGWLAKGVSSFEEMGNVPGSLKRLLAEEGYYIGQPEVVTEQISEADGTRKCLYEFRDGARVESVFMKYSYGNSICISSQVGCRMGCTFCASTIGSAPAGSCVLTIVSTPPASARF